MADLQFVSNCIQVVALPHGDTSGPLRVALQTAFRKIRGSNLPNTLINLPLMLDIASLLYLDYSFRASFDADKGLVPLGRNS